MESGPMLEVGIVDGVGVMWLVGRTEEEMEVTRGDTEELTGVEAAEGDTKAETDGGGDAVGLVTRGEWETELGVSVDCRVEVIGREVGGRGDVREDGGEDAEGGRKDVVRPELGGRDVDDGRDGEWGLSLRETKVDSKLVGGERALVEDEKEGEIVDLWGTEEGLHPEGEVVAVVNEVKASVMAMVVDGIGGTV